MKSSPSEYGRTRLILVFPKLLPDLETGVDASHENPEDKNDLFGQPVPVWKIGDTRKMQPGEAST